MQTVKADMVAGNSILLEKLPKVGDTLLMHYEGECMGEAEVKSIYHTALDNYIVYGWKNPFHSGYDCVHVLEVKDNVL